VTRRSLLTILCGVLPVACRQPAPTPVPSAPPAPIVREARLQNGFISVRLEVPPGPDGPKPAIITLLGEREALLDLGMVVVTYEINWELLKGLAPPTPPAASGTAVGVWLLAAPTPKTVGQGYFGIIAANADRAIPTVLDYLATVPDVDPGRIGVTGASTNGFIALEAVADARVAAAAAIAACGDYHRFLHLSNLAMNGKPLDLDPTYERTLREQEPVRHPARFAHAAVLMVNGTEDHSVPAACALPTARRFRAAFARAGRPERFRFVLVEGAGHDVAAQARYEVLAWFRRWLLPPAGGRPAVRPQR
jgi:dienelactone hydrolase